LSGWEMNGTGSGSCPVADFVNLWALLLGS